MAVVLITGCSSGLGASTALAFAKKGDTVIATMRRMDRASALRARVLDAGVSLEIIELDVSSAQSVGVAVTDVLKRHRAIDVLVNNAGVAHVGAIETTPLEFAQEVVDTNFWGAVRMIQAVLPTMRARDAGVVINVSSVAGRIAPLPFSSWYSVSKHAVCLLSEALHMELLGTNVRVVSVEPGFFKTSLVARTAPPAPAGNDYTAEEEWVASFYEAGTQNGGDPNEVAVAIIAAATDPATPLHLAVPAFRVGVIPAGAPSFEETVARQIATLEAVSGPRPSRNTP